VRQGGGPEVKSQLLHQAKRHNSATAVWTASDVLSTSSVETASSGACLAKMGSGSSTDHLRSLPPFTLSLPCLPFLILCVSSLFRNTFFNSFLLEKDWKECDKYFKAVEATNGEILSNNDCQIIYLLSGEVSMYYVNHDEQTPNPASLLKVLLPGQLYCLFDTESDMFESGRSLKMILQSTSSESDPTKFLCISNERLTDFLSASHLQALKSIFQTRSVSCLLFCHPPLPVSISHSLLQPRDDPSE
jgi:hypothetical protein